MQNQRDRDGVILTIEHPNTARILLKEAFDGVIFSDIKLGPREECIGLMRFRKEKTIVSGGIIMPLDAAFLRQH